MTTPATFPLHRRHPFWKLARIEAVLLGRTPQAVIWMAVLPIAAIIVLSSLHGTTVPNQAFGGLSALDVYLPIIMVFSLVMSAIVSLPGVLTTYREKGILRRFATTPVPRSYVLGAQAVIYLGIGVAVDVILFVIAIASGAEVPGDIGGFILSLLLVALVTLGIGLLVTALAPSARVAQAIGGVLLFPLMFFAGLWVPRSTMSPALRTISDYSPLGAGVRAVQASIGGQWPAAAALLVMVGYTIVCGAIAVRMFRWE
ncbi:MAG TPA: ABC transporter permease [Acidimicrobiales bacterium]|nr:ABC transporter permease [Acidimicrobiales bacterium]